MLIIRLRNLLLGWPDPVAEARLYLDPTHQVYPIGGSDKDSVATTNSVGEAKLIGLAPGEHSLWIVPKLATNEPVGHWTGTGPDVPRIFRGLQIRLTVDRSNKVVCATLHSVTADNGTLNANLANPNLQVLEVKLRPIWIKSPYHYDRRGQKIDMVVIHKTGGESIGSAINQFLNGGTSAHYLVGRDGHIVKMVVDGLAAGHASHENAQDQSHWGTQTRLAWRSIGIENVGSVQQSLTDPQYKSLIRLVQELMKTHGIPRCRVVGHSDILTDGHGHLSDDRIACPGYQFEWDQLEAAGIGLARVGGTSSDPDPVAEFFTMMNNGLMLSAGKTLTLKPGDFDTQGTGKNQTSKFGGNAYKEVTGTPIKQLQTWLAEIGYSIGPANGQFNRQMARAVRHFQVHFEGRSDNEKINAKTAAMIRAVRLANPKAD